MANPMKGFSLNTSRKVYKNYNARGAVEKLPNWERTFINSYSNFALYKAGDVVAAVKHRERPHDVLLQPIPVLNYLLLRDTWPNISQQSAFLLMITST